MTDIARRTRARPRTPAALLTTLIAGGAVVAGCGGAPPAATPPVPPAAGPPPASTSPTTAPAPAEPAVSPVTTEELGASWRPGCPLRPERLRRVEVDHLGFDGRTHRGELIVHQDLVAEVVTIFEKLYQLRYPIEKIRTVEHYPGAADELSMRDNNTSAFNCRGIPGSDQWSYHAYGRAIDVNPLLNPFIDSTGAYQPSNAGDYLDRSRTDPGLLHPGDPAVLVFTDLGWGWGGDWRSPIDYQHFERP